MMELGYSLSSEEHGPKELVAQARQAEEVGFSFALISDHFHPWTERQGQSPFVWTVIGAIAQATSRLRLGTGVTCPLIRIHPAVIAQAAATSAAMLPGRFFLGVGTGENLNEHILGTHWPDVDVRLEMLEEAVEIIRLLWRGETVSHRGRYYLVENARIYTRPSQPPPMLVAGSGTKSARLAGKIGDGYIGTAPKPEAITTFENAGGRGKPRYGQMTVCWAEDQSRARKTARELWPTAGLSSELTQELKLPAHFEQATTTVREEDISKTIVCGPDPDAHVARIREYENAGYDHVYVHQVGPEQDGFFRFYQREVIPRLGLGRAQAKPQAAMA
ncbi:MAG: TIGR03557 family F420-dependent LLM class oxidoreductase [Chloroflexi bacterium]|nr:MAG: TIGR03557 family F420-dependent LLM class oxidoreductase [Chloroflexota bacterium]